ncbi:MAG: winged helix-turn-helix transcriptional regulator [Bacteroidetes bacterium]|nr:winged helix-turn-helix transcriptional regulator [Bacteroidota bacterium]
MLISLSATFSDDIIEKLTTAELENCLNKTINGLPDQCKSVFLLNRNEDLSYSQIATRLNISKNTVKTQILRALEN